MSSVLVETAEGAPDPVRDDGPIGPGPVEAVVGEETLALIGTLTPGGVQRGLRHLSLFGPDHRRGYV